MERGQAARILSVGTPYALAFSDMALVPLRSNVPIAMSLGLHIQILETDDTNNRFTVTTTQYSYTLATSEGGEILVFHWNPAARGAAIRFPHLHVGPAVVSRSTQIRPRTFHKVHVPTGYVSMQSVIRLAITEFGVTPLRRDWEDILVEPEVNPIR